ncbi:MAG: glycosyltransferase family 39 protein [Bacteroidales bacterium]|jgi:4-amino-4-deoxy-L-arabinose transferase-like glycosyltransferase|nr:glycosyltransferase family 39 protein [Bacteroidales bacterium]
MKYPHLYFFLFIAGLFLLIISPNFLSDGMFLDGLMYSTIAKNMAEGLGTFWNPLFTRTISPEFHGHPPLAMGIQSIFYTLFGESRYVEKIYSFLTFVVTACILLKIWKTLNLKNGWSILLLWFTVPVVMWACPNNLLENTMMIFTTLSVYFYVKGEKNGRLYFLLLAGLSLSLGFLTKGFVAFFPWTLPFIDWLFLQRKTFVKMLINSVLLVSSTLLPLLLLVVISPEARWSLQQYLDQQIVWSFQNVATVDSRFFIIKRVFLDLLPALVLSGGMLLYYKLTSRRVDKWMGERVDWRLGLAFLTLALTGVVPIMISMKQSLFYTLPAFPIFAIAFAIFINPVVNLLHDRLKISIIFKVLACVLFVAGIGSTFYFSNKIGRDEARLKTVYAVGGVIPKNQTIGISPDLHTDWSLHGYFFRYFNISLDWNQENTYEYRLVPDWDGGYEFENVSN